MKGDAARLDHPGQFPRGQDMVDIAGQAGPDRLVLLGRAGHDADHVRLLPALGKGGTERAREGAALRQGAMHLLRRPGRAQVVQQVGPVDFHPVHPSRATGSQQGQGLRVSCLPLYTRQQLAGFFHDRQVGAEIGVEHVVKTKLSQGIDHFSRTDRAGQHAEFFADGNAGGGRNLHHGDALVRIQGV